MAVSPKTERPDLAQLIMIVNPYFRKLYTENGKSRPGAPDQVLSDMLESIRENGLVETAAKHAAVFTFSKLGLDARRDSWTIYDPSLPRIVAQFWPGKSRKVTFENVVALYGLIFNQTHYKQVGECMAGFCMFSFFYSHINDIEDPEYIAAAIVLLWRGHLMIKEIEEIASQM